MSVSFDHEAIVELFRRQPLLVADLLALIPGLDPQADAAELLPADLTVLRPTERRADAVVRLTGAADPVAVIGEIQLQPDPEKPWVWPLYVTSTRDRLRCTVLLLVLTLDEATAKWARKPILLGNPGSAWTPIVIGPSQIPVITSAPRALAHPELAVVSAIAHGQGEQAEAVGLAALEAVATLDDARSPLYADIILWSLCDRARKVLEALMTQPYEYKSDFARKYFGQGRGMEGRTILLRQLHRRFGSLPDWVSARLEEAGLEQIEAWADAIFDAPSLEALLGPAP